MDNLEDFLTEKKKMNKTKKLHLVLKDVGISFYFINFIPKLHILATRGQHSGILTIFGHISAIWEDFLTEIEKSE